MNETRTGRSERQGASSERLLSTKSPAALSRFILTIQVLYLIVPFSFFSMMHLGILPIPSMLYEPSEAFLQATGLVYLLSWVSIFLLSIAFSTLGVFLSYISRNDPVALERDQRRRKDALFLSISVYGIIAGVIVLLLFLGGFVRGALFPDLLQWGTGYRDLFYSVTHFDVVAKLCVWSFVAGFSERIIPRTLEQFASQFETSLKTNTADGQADDAAENQDGQAR